MFQHVGGSVPITAVAFAGPLLLCGEGGTLKLYDPADQSLITSLDVLGSTSIHGIDCRDATPDSYTILVWGGALTAVLDLHIPSGESSKAELELVTAPVTCPDWILDAKLRLGRAPSGSLDIVLITAHNALLFLHISDKGSTLDVATAQSRSILYSAALSWEADDSVLVVSGTVFGQIIVWSANFASDSPKQGSISTTLHKVFTGHEGSPFGLHIDAVRTSGQSQIPRFVASCSDDRTVRLWDIDDLSSIAVDPHAAIDYASLVGGDNTGYNATSSALTDVKSGCFASAMGHLSRIWGVYAFRHGAGKDVIHVATFGEDATCHIWKYDSSIAALQPASTGTLKLVKRFDCHAGKNIWSHDVRKVKENAVQIATGGADGSISLHDFVADQPLLSSQQESAPGRPGHSDKSRSYAFLSENTLVVTTNSGNVYQVDLSQESSFVLDDLDAASAANLACNEPDLAGFGMAAGIPALSLCFLAGKSGTVYLYRNGKGLLRWLPHDTKPAGIFAQSLPNSPEGTLGAFCLATWIGKPVAVLCSIHYLDNPTKELNSLQLPSGELVTSFCRLYLGENLCLVGIGFRSGLKAYYKIDSGHPGDFLPVLKRQYHSDAVSDMLLLDTSDGIFVHSTCRDGSYSIEVLKLSGEDLDAELVHHLQVPSLTEAHKLCHRDGQLRVAGFHRKHFVLWDVTTERELVSIDCGGSNRMWTYEPSGTLAWTQASAVHIEKIAPSVHDIKINDGGHGREIKTMALSGHDQLDGAILATGSEDTDIKLNRVTVFEGRLAIKCLRTLRGHNTGIQSLCWTDDNRRLISSGGMEELFVWRVTEVPGLGVGVRCESKCPFTSAVPDLRVTDVAVREQGPDKLTIAACRSDSSVHVYEYGIIDGEGSWSCVGAGTYLRCALTSLSWLGEDALLATGTDGHAVIFDSRPGQDLEWKTRFKLHQSASHCAKALAWTGGETIVVSGGDDNSISVSRLGSTHHDTVTIPRAHAAAVTGLSVIGMDMSAAKIRLVSASLDQMVKMWEIAVEKDKISVAKVCSIGTAVADASQVYARRDGDGLEWVLICGVGWEAWKIR